MPVANSTTSMPRVIEPSASASVLPCSCVTILREVLLVRVHQLAKAHQDACAAQRRLGAPAGNARGRGAHGGVDVRGIGERHMADDFAGCRIGHFAVARGLRRRRRGRRSTAAAVRVWSGPWLPSDVGACIARSAATVSLRSSSVARHLIPDPGRHIPAVHPPGAEHAIHLRRVPGHTTRCRHKVCMRPDLRGRDRRARTPTRRTRVHRAQDVRVALCRRREEARNRRASRGVKGVSVAGAAPAPARRCDADRTAAPRNSISSESPL